MALFNIERFGAEAIHNIRNMERVAVDSHIGKGSISAYYSSKQAFAGGLTVRKWLARSRSMSSMPLVCR